MAEKVPDKSKVEKLKKDIEEEKKLWDKIKGIPKEDKFFLNQLKELTKRHKVTKKPTTNKSLKERADKLFWGLQPPDSTKSKKK